MNKYYVGDTIEFDVSLAMNFNVDEFSSIGLNSTIFNGFIVKVNTDIVICNYFYNFTVKDSYSNIIFSLRHKEGPSRLYKNPILKNKIVLLMEKKI